MAGFKPSEWTLRAACRGMNDQLFPESRRQHDAKSICFECEVRMDCLAEALDNRIEWGVWGGLTERERRTVLRQRPGVKSWALVLQRASGREIVTTAEADELAS